MKEFYEEYYRPSTEDVRFSLPQLMGALGHGWKSRNDRASFAEWIEYYGAVRLGQARVGKGGTHKDDAWGVPDGEWRGFVADAGRWAPDARPALKAKRIRATKEDLLQRLAALEERVAQLENQALGTR